MVPKGVGGRRHCARPTTITSRQSHPANRDTLIRNVDHERFDTRKSCSASSLTLRHVAYYSCSVTTSRIILTHSFCLLYIVVAPLIAVANMHLTTFILATATAIGLAQADFMVYTVPPIPTDSIPKFTDPAEVRQSLCDARLLHS